MARRDKYHAAVRAALVQDGWTITHDPLGLVFGSHNLYVDLGAERLFAAERGSERIAVEVKTFFGPSPVADLEQALGQYLMYRSVLQRIDPGRDLFLALPSVGHDAIMNSDLGRTIREDFELLMLVFDPQQEVIRRWLRPQPMPKS